MVADLRTELVYGSPERLADMICNTVTDWSLPCPVLPLSSVQQWHKAREIVRQIMRTSATMPGLCPPLYENRA
ncbi:hypothetical protein TUM12130_52100 (plasmid) [Klebsiella pneumoniae]|nr:hypothetical protein TUM12130_52100 [Klebsiella pneumoniae]